jgi:hypothetical protein
LLSVPWAAAWREKPIRNLDESFDWTGRDGHQEGRPIGELSVRWEHVQASVHQCPKAILCRIGMKERLKYRKFAD